MGSLCEKLIELFVSDNLLTDEDKELYKYSLNLILSALLHIAKLNLY